MRRAIGEAHSPRTILANCHEAMKGDAKLLIIDPQMGPPNEQVPGNLYDMIFMTLMTGGVRTADEYSELLARAQFRLQRVVPTEADVSILEAVAL